VVWLVEGMVTMEDYLLFCETQRPLQLGESPMEANPYKNIVKCVLTTVKATTTGFRMNCESFIRRSVLAGQVCNYIFVEQYLLNLQYYNKQQQVGDLPDLTLLLKLVVNKKLYVKLLLCVR
jgi:hypothetical protein